MIGFDGHHLFTRGPLLPLVLSPGILLQHPVLWIVVLNVAASIGTSILVFEACLLWSQSRLASLAAAFFVLANPWLIWCVKNPTPTVTATFFVALASYFLVRVALSSGGKAMTFCVCLGVSCALAALDHPPLIALIAGFSAALLLILWSRRSLSPVLGLLFLWISFAACIAPYTYRNYRISGRLIPIADSAGFSYFMGTGQYGSSLYPVGDYRDFGKLASRLHVKVEDLDEKFYTLDDRYYPLLSSMAKQDVTNLLVKHPLYLLVRTVVMSLWFFAADKYAWLSIAHCAYWLIFACGAIVALRHQVRSAIVPFVVIVLPGMLLHGLSMPLIGHAAYSIPYCVPLSLPLAIGLKDFRLLSKFLL
jgi:4-amino-4-deoxy-L-arabinose transferase-like glycosyltransferase